MAAIALFLRIVLELVSLVLGFVALWREDYPKAAAYFALVAAVRRVGGDY